MKSHNWPLSRKKWQQAFSLLEVLIASTVFSVVLLVASSAFKFFMSIGSRAVNSEAVMQESINTIKIRSAIKGIQHYYIRESAVSSDKAKLFFLGEKEGFTAITINGIDFVHQPARISISKLRDDSKKWNLVYCEYDNGVLFPLAHIEATCDAPKIIAANIKEVNFSYFGWISLNALYGIGADALFDTSINQKIWATPWSAPQRGILPQYIKIEVTYEEGEKSYQPTQLWFHISDADPTQFNMNNLDEE